jgi:proteasome accessory factor C
LNDYLQPLLSHVKNKLNAKGRINQRTECIKIIPLGHQYIPDDIFLPLCQSVLDNTKVTVDYCDIEGKHSRRELSPQRLVCYRNNWYLDAWCHLRQGLRTFWVPSIKSIEALTIKGHVIDEHWLTEQLESSYGIFDGEPKEIAHLRFTGQAVRRIHKAQWHPMQKQQMNDDGSLDMWVPYSNYHELMRDVLRYGAQAQVLAPESLKKAMRDEIALMMKLNP